MRKGEGVEGAGEEGILGGFSMNEWPLLMKIVIHETVDVVQANALAEKQKVSRLIGQ